MTLIKRLEMATGADRELDLAIFNEIAKDKWRWFNIDRSAITCDRYGPGAVGNPICSLEQFSESVNDALTLKPEGMEFRIECGSFNYCSVEVFERRPFGKHIKRGFCERPDDCVALAIATASLEAIAALNARTAQEKPE